MHHINVSVLLKINLKYQLFEPPKSLFHSQTCAVVRRQVGLEHGFLLVGEFIPNTIGFIPE